MLSGSLPPTLQITEIEERLETFRHEIESSLDRLLQQKQYLPHSILFEAARYSLLSPAKRVRPLLMLATCEALGHPPEHALSPACALEMIHTYSLIHDDLPCMDNDDMRRGKPTLHKMYPEAYALLAGDFLLTYAFEVLVAAPHISDSQKVALVHCLAETSGGNGMIGGQVIDMAMEAAKLSPSWEHLRDMHDKKTAALMVAALDGAAIIANAPSNLRKQLQQLGKDLGLAFQIVDDILDITGSEEEIGKPVGSDVRNHKTTAVSLLGLEQAKEVAQNHLVSAETIIRSLPYNSDLLLYLAHKLVHRSK